MTDLNGDRAGLLFDYAVVHPDGFTNVEAMEDLEWSLRYFNEAVRDLRLILAGDSINLIADPAGEREPWIYRLVGTFTDARAWSSNRLRDMEARLETIQAVAFSIVGSTDGRTTDGRKAKLIVAVVGALREQLHAMNDQGRLWQE